MSPRSAKSPPPPATYDATVGWFTRHPRSASTPLLLAPPRLNDSAKEAIGRAPDGFAAATVRQLGLEMAFSQRAHEVADLICARLLPVFRLQAEPEDLPHVIDLLRSAAQTGAGIGLVESRNSTIEANQLSANAAGALALAFADLPPMPTALGRQALYALRAGHYLARLGDEQVAKLESDLLGERPEN